MTDNSTSELLDEQPAENDTDAETGTEIETEIAPLAPHAPVRPDSPAFSDFDVQPGIVAALAEAGIVRTFAIQELTLPIALAGNDLIGQARTGTGKTLGFGVPLLNRLNLPGGDAAAPQALVIAPTRELAVQVSADIAAAGKKLGARVLTIYGGRAYEPQIDALRKGIDVVVGTPGRLLDLVQQGHLVLGAVRILVLDEADEMLDLGFLPDIEKLLAMVPAQRQTMLFSATMPGPIVALARTFLNQPIQIRAEQGTETPRTDHIDQFAYRAHAMDKTEVLARILQARNRGLTLIFTRTKRTAAKVVDNLVERGFAAAAMHGDLGQGAREQALRAFRSGKVDVMVATDVAARGWDVEGISHVINYQAPEDEMTYVHRIGRTARAGASGNAITLVDWDDLPRWKLICDKLGLPFHTPVETYSTSPHLYLELDIPSGAGSTLPRSDRTRAGLGAEEIEDLGGRDSKRGAPPRHGERRATGGGQRGGSRGGPPGDSRSAEPGTRVERPARQPRQRNRRRTRSGAVLDASAAAPAAEAPAGGAPAGGAPAGGAPAGGAPVTGANPRNTASSGGDAASARPRRRRRRPNTGSGSAGAAGTAAPSAE